MQDPLSMDNNEFMAMADVIEQHCLEELYGMDWYNPTCYAIKILDAKYEAYGHSCQAMHTSHQGAKSGLETSSQWISDPLQRKAWSLSTPQVPH